MHYVQLLENLRKWKRSLESKSEGMLPEWPEMKAITSQIATLEGCIDFIEATQEENEELGRMLKEKGMQEGEFLPGFLERLVPTVQIP